MNERIQCLSGPWYEGQLFGSCPICFEKKQLSQSTVLPALEPCPFCGSDKLISHRQPARIYEGMGAAWIRCDNCHCQLFAPYYDNLVVMWNTRAGKDAPMEGRKFVEFLRLTAGTANAIAYQLEIGKENHSCPVDDATIAKWLRDLANQLDPTDRLKGNDGYHHPITKTPPTRYEP